MASGVGQRSRLLGSWVCLLAAVLLLPVAATEGAELRFREIASETGVTFRHQHGGTGEFFMIETMGSGALLLDFDDDGDQDALFVDSGDLYSEDPELARVALYRNDHGTFVDWTAASGLKVTSYGMGGTAADVDNDGDIDLYVTAFGANQLFSNEGDGTFTDITGGSGVDDGLWGSSAAFADVDRDGNLDLYVTNYVDFSFDDNPPCGDEARNLRSYCHPDVYDGQPDRFFRGNGDGTFVDATAASGFAAAAGKGLGVIFGDMNRDGWIDLYVTNDMTANFLFLNRGGGKFEEVAMLSGTAFGEGGNPEAGMGVDMGDLNGDGHPEIMATHLDMQSNALYSSTGLELFIDQRYPAGIAEPSFYKVGFGVAFADFDQDGRLDIAVANGHIIHNIDDWDRGTTYKQQNQVFVNQGGGRFAELPDSGLDAIRSSRGLAAGDLDLDGDLDLVISNSDDYAEVYRNEVDAAGHWLQIESRGAGANRSGIGAAIVVEVEGGIAQRRELRTASSYQSQNALWAHFGLGTATRVDRLTISWPNGVQRRIRNLPADHRVQIFQ